MRRDTIDRDTVRRARAMLPEGAPDVREDKLERLIAAALDVPGWLPADELRRLGRETLALAENATLVEIGCFFGRTALVLAGALEMRGSGVLHCIDPFDASGDSFSTPHYERLLAAHGGGCLRDHVTAMLGRHGLLHRVCLHTARATEVPNDTFGPVDLLFLDGDQSPVGAHAAYAHWAPALRPGGLLAVGNSARRVYDADHGGHALVVENYLSRDGFTLIERGKTSFARAGDQRHP